MPYRPLVFVSGLTFGDYLLWNWSLNGNRDLLALVSGLTLPPLLVACLWLLALSIGRLIARTTRRPAARSGTFPGTRRTGGTPDAERRAATGADPMEEGPSRASPAGTPPGKIAA